MLNDLAPERSSRISLEYQRQMSHSPWRSRILTMLSDRRERDQTPYAHYNIAVERVSIHIYYSILGHANFLIFVQFHGQ